MKVTIKDIAKELGLSVATVSRALNDSFEINAETKYRVQKKAREMKYKPNIYARNLLKQRSNMIGVVVPEFITFFFPEIIIGIQDVMNAAGYQVLICQSNESSDLERKNIEMLENCMIEGLIVSVTKESHNMTLYRRLIDDNLPIVFINRVLPDIEGGSQVIIDDYKWAYTVVEHLIKCGYKRIAHLAGNKGLSVTQRRLEGYMDALKAYDIPVKKEFIMHVGVQQDRAKIGVKYLLSLKEKIDAIFAINDPVAIGAMLEIQKQGLKVPDNIAIAGFTESPTGRILGLTSVSQPTFEIGAVAANLLCEKIKNINAPSQIKILDAKLNIRNSTIPQYKKS